MKDQDVLEKNVSSLLETGGDPPRISDAARARIRAELVTKFGAEQHVSLRRPLGFALIGVVAAAALALVFFHKAPRAPLAAADGTLADGSTYVAAPGARVTVVGPRHVRVEGRAVLDVVPGKGTFTVDTARGTIEVLGTRFYVDGEAERTVAAVVRGEVKLASDLGQVLLHAGEQGIAQRGRAPVREPAPRLSQLTAWSHEMHPGAGAHHGTLFARDPGLRSHPPWGHEFPLPIAKLGVDVVVQDRVARVALDQTFHNPSPEELEGVYRFAIPSDAALQRLAMYVDGKLEESAVVERMAARRIYEELVYRRVDPALLEWAGTGRLSLRVYPLHGNQDKRVVLAYTQSLPELYDDWTLTVPLPETDQPVGELAATVRVAGCAQCELSSTSHAITVEKQGDDAIVHVVQKGEKLADSLVLRVRDKRHAPVVASHVDGGDRYWMVRAPVELDRTPRTYKPRTWVILDDVSASRTRGELRAQQDVIDAFVHELDENDKLAVVAFDVEARTKLQPTRVLDVDRTKLREALKDEGGVGATDFAVGLDAALQLASSASGDTSIVYIGDGVITAGPRELDTLRAKMIGKAQFVGVGVGDSPDTQTLSALAGATAGYTTTIDLADDLAWRTFDLVAALHTPRVTDVSARLVDASDKLVPATVYLASPQLADGEELDLVAKLAGAGTPAAVELDGMADGVAWHRRVELAQAPHDGGYLPRLWAQRHIAARLLAKHEPAPPGMTREERDEQIRKEVVALGKRYFLLSRHTSLLVLENDAMYAQYGVTKGSGETWAPYALPTAIPVTTTAQIAAPPADGELVRAPLPVFYDANAYAYRWQRGGFDDHDLETGVGDGGFAQPMSRLEAIEHARDAGILGNIEKQQPVTASQTGYGTTGIEQQVDTLNGKSADDPFGDHLQLDEGKMGYLAYDRRAAFGARLSLARYIVPTDTIFDDVTAFVPALFPDEADAWRKRLADSATAGNLDAAARAQLERARAALAAGVYRWGDREIAIDGAHRFGWRATTETALTETAAFDGATFTRRYAELGLDVTRTIGDDDVALALAYLPVWIAEPAHYAHYFDVRARGPHEVVLAHGTRVAFVLAFDDADHLIAIHDGDGGELVSVTWHGNTPTAARVRGEAVRVGFAVEAIADAAAWAHGGSHAGVAIELPLHQAAGWQERADRLVVGTPEWRHAERQRMASLAATQDLAALFAAYEQLRAHGGVELGDLALASGALSTGCTTDQFAAATAPLSHELLARYIAAGRAYADTQQAGKLAPETRDGGIGALWSLRLVAGEIAVHRGKAAVDALGDVPASAPELRAIGASAMATQYDLAPSDLARAWDLAAVGSYANTARAQAALVLMGRGDFEACADEIARLADHLDLAAPPARFDNALYAFQQSRRGEAGWQIVWAAWRDRVLAGDSYAHVIALVPLAAQRPDDVTALLARAAQLAGDDTRRVAEIARLAIAHGQSAWAQRVVEPLLKRTPSRELYQIDGQLELAQGNTAAALASLEAAQDVAGDGQVALPELRAELAQILGLARQLALSSTGAERDRALEHAKTWAKRWRAIDPGNNAIDQTLGQLLLAVGDRAGAWRALSSTIERDPWSGAGYTIVAEAFEHEGKVADALPFWHQAVIIDQTNPTPRLREAQALIALGRTAEGDAELKDIANRKWHDAWSNVVYQAQELLAREKKPSR